MTQSKFNPNKNGKAGVTHHIIKNYDENGIFYQHGLGCDKYADCFSCPFYDCIWDNSSLTRRQPNVSVG